MHYLHDPARPLHRARHSAARAPFHTEDRTMSNTSRTTLTLTLVAAAMLATACAPAAPNTAPAPVASPRAVAVHIVNRSSSEAAVRLTTDRWTAPTARVATGLEQTVLVQASPDGAPTRVTATLVVAGSRTPTTTTITLSASRVVLSVLADGSMQFTPVLPQTAQR